MTTSKAEPLTAEDAKTKLLSAISAFGPVARMGRVPQGGEQTGNLEDIETAYSWLPRVVATIDALTSALAEARKYGATENAKALSWVKNPCKVHNQYWTTAMGCCMACRAEKAETALAAEKERGEKVAATLPATYYADRPLDVRVEFMVAHWGRLVEITQRLEEENAAATKAVEELSGTLRECDNAFAHKGYAEDSPMRLMICAAIDAAKEKK